MVEELVLDYHPHKAQQEFHDIDSRFKAFIAGIGSGKTIAGALEGIKYMCENPGSHGMIVSPDFPMMSKSTKPTFMDNLPDVLISEINKGEKYVKLKNGSVAYWASANDPESLRGVNLSWFWIDEASLVSINAWRIMIGRIRDKRFPSRGWITTTPKGFNWIYKKFVLDKKEGYEMVHCSSRDNPHLSDDFIESLEEDYPGSFARQEIEGDFVHMEGVVYPGFSRNTHVVKEYPEFKRVIAGVDWGFSNAMVCLVIGVDGDDRMWVIDEFYQSKTTMATFVEVCKGFKEKYGVEQFYCDPSEPEHIQQFNNSGLVGVKANNDIMPGIQKVSSRLVVAGDEKPRLFVHERCVNVLMEFENYAYHPDQEGKEVKEKPLKVFDHAMDALRYATMSMESGFAIGFLRSPEGVL